MAGAAAWKAGGQLSIEHMAHQSVTGLNLPGR